MHQIAAQPDLPTKDQFRQLLDLHFATTPSGQQESIGDLTLSEIIEQTRVDNFIPALAFAAVQVEKSSKNQPENIPQAQAWARCVRGAAYLEDLLSPTVQNTDDFSFLLVKSTKFETTVQNPISVYTIIVSALVSNASIYRPELLESEDFANWLPTEKAQQRLHNLLDSYENNLSITFATIPSCPTQKSFSSPAARQGLDLKPHSCLRKTGTRFLPVSEM